MSNAEFLEKCKIIFNKANGGQPLTVGALAKVIREVCPNYNRPDQEIAEIFLEIDKSGDRLISWEEFESAMTAKDPKEITRARLEELFQQLDKDKSGKLSRNEVKQLCQKVGLKISEENLDALIDAADHNKDGEIDYEELLDAWFNAS